jgi:hypothetical protein
MYEDLRDAPSPSPCESHPDGVQEGSRGVEAEQLERSGSAQRRPPDARHQITTPKGWQNSSRPLATGLLAITAIAICLASQVKINYHDQDFTLSGFDNFSATLEDQGTTFKGDGKPLKIEIQSSGTTITGTTADGMAKRGTSGPYFLENATISGNANLLMDGQIAQEFADRKRDSKAPAVPAPITKTQIESDVLKYSGTATDGRVEFPGAVTIDSSTNGKSVGKDKATSDVSRVLHLTGASGFVTMQLGGAGNNALQTGEIAGPVTYSGNSTTTPAKGTAVETTFQGKADNMKFDFSKEPRTLTLTGNVTLTSKGAAASGDISADTVVVTLDANLKPTKVDITGNPAKTTLHQEPPK